jgi:cobalt/nickel transport system permease protein
MLGWGAFPAIMVALTLQAVMFQYGGITALGVNTVIMAVPALLCYFLFARFIPKEPSRALPAAFACGFFAVFLSAVLMAVALIFTEEDFFKLSMLVIVTHLPVMIIEGIITGFCVSFLKKVKPELLPGPK